MASFSFGAGNARKLASIPLYAAGRMLTLLVPRTRDEWVFGCGAGIGDGALALWHVAAAEHPRSVWLVGSPREATDAAALGIPTAHKSSLRGLWRTARASVIVVTHGFGDVNRYAVSGAFVVQLWHGVPLKRIGLDSPETLRLPGPIARSALAPLARRLLGAMFRAATRRIRVLPAASHAIRARLESAFALPDTSVPVTGEPRVDVLSRGTPRTRRSTARAGIDRACGPFETDTRLVLYAPTWRDGAADPAVPSADEWKELHDLLVRHDAALLVRSHPLGAGDYRPPFATDRVRALGSDTVADVTPMLPAVDVLVTDYSSLVFDAALVPLPVVFLAPDVADYARRRGFYGRYADVAGDDPAPDWATAIGQLDAVLGDRDERDRRIERARELSAHVHAYDDGGNAARVYRAILAGSTAEDRPTKGSR
ncbi:CDP-glycerol glycerophosphotransferase family protein [Microbacterium sp. CFBP9034]|uniref:CDP-glycerol glycerophosphotransferase family protein n=1 Tax=Microbacterium sp. CFBP9034 TaxID=3096540 RepID=UPI002A6A8B61|nr:CDP-glycerol glycerophosphotransferase family protein [Microbacterium sp. CFBP9034]MDY0909333.1 CDP-glycerol glycerophosphotransferase family protein [Microbacterium sp. CFBP9034]